MSKVLSAADLSTKLAENITIDDQNKVVLKDGGKIWAEHLPDGVTVDQINALSDYRGKFTQAIATSVGKAVVEHAKTHDDVAHMEFLLETPDVDFGFGFARPETKGGKKPSPELIEAGLTAYNRVRAVDTMADTMKELAALWD